MTFVQILNRNTEEAIFYFQNNRRVSSEMALEIGYIDSFQILETPYSKEEPIHIVIITTFKNKEQYDNREEPYHSLLKEIGSNKIDE